VKGEGSIQGGGWHLCMPGLCAAGEKSQSKLLKHFTCSLVNSVIQKVFQEEPQGIKRPLRLTAPAGRLVEMLTKNGINKSIGKHGWAGDCQCSSC